MATAKKVVLELTKPEALALLNAADTGLKVIEALHLVPSLGLTQGAYEKLRAAVYGG